MRARTGTGSLQGQRSRQWNRFGPSRRSNGLPAPGNPFSPNGRRQSQSRRRFPLCRRRNGLCDGAGAAVEAFHHQSIFPSGLDLPDFGLQYDKTPFFTDRKKVPCSNVNNIQVVYNNVIMVLKGISLEVPEGKAVALLGANAAGKTTTLKAISGILRFQNGELEEGDIEFRGRSIREMDPDTIVRMGICLVPEGRRVFDDLSVIENLWIGAHTRRDRSSGKA